MATEAQDAPEWTWVGDWDTHTIHIAPAGEGRLAVIWYALESLSIGLLDGEGRLVWSRRVGGPDVWPHSVAVGDDGTIYVGGWFAGTADFGGDADDSLSTQTCRHEDGVRPCQEAFVAAYDQAGELRWVRNFAGWHVYHVAATRGGVVVQGYYWWQGPPASEELAPAPPVGRSFFVAQLDAAGNEVWRYRDPVADCPTFVYDMAVDASGAIVLSVWYDFGDVLVRLSADGQEVWRRAAVDAGLLALAEDGDIIVTLSNHPLINRYDGATGELRWRIWLGGNGPDGELYTSDVAIDPSGDVVVLGTITGRATVGQSTLEAAGPSDLLVVKLRGEDGWPLAAATSGIAGGDGAGTGGVIPFTRSLVVLDRDDIAVAGHFSGELPVDGEIVVPPPDAWGGVLVRRGNPFAPD